MKPGECECVGWVVEEFADHDFVSFSCCGFRSGSSIGDGVWSVQVFGKNFVVVFEGGLKWLIPRFSLCEDCRGIVSIDFDRYIRIRDCR